MGKHSFFYVILGIAATLAIVSILFLTGVTMPHGLPSIPMPTDTLSGRVVGDVGSSFNDSNNNDSNNNSSQSNSSNQPATVVGIMLHEGETKVISLAGIDYDVTAVAVVAPDTTGKPSGVLTVNGVWTYRMYNATSKVIASSQKVRVTVTAITSDAMTVSLSTTSDPVTSLPAAKLINALSTGEEKTFALDGYDATVRFAFFSSAKQTGTFVVNSISTQDLTLGQTGIASNVAITLQDLYTRHDGTTVAVILIEKATSCGVIDRQTATCRGSAACCGGVCTPLVSCENMPDGEAPSCGARQMYCCNGKLGFVACNTCVYNNVSYTLGQSFPSSDGCNSCTCGLKGIMCTMRMCLGNETEVSINATTCTYNGITYDAGQGFPSSDGCNSCTCRPDGVICTMRMCLGQSNNGAGTGGGQ